MKFKVSLIVLFLSASAANLFGQVSASFTTDVVSGCSPLKVTFVNNSTGTIENFEWDFGNGNTTTTEENPQAIYTNPGSYTASLTVSDGTNTDEASITITVFANPAADFTATETEGCSPFNGEFNNNTTLGDAPIETFKWDFRAGFIDNRENPSYTYTAAGFYDVYFEVIDTNGCGSNIEKQGYIEVVSSPTSIFTINPTTACSAPAEVTFSNYSSGTGTITYDWEFGDDATSTEEEPTHTFSDIGEYIVKLTVNSDYGCSTATTKLFEIKDIVASGELDQEGTPINDGNFICPGLVNYKNTSTGTENVYWDFGDGDVSYAAEGSHYFSKGGNYTVTLIADPGDLCADTVKWDIEVDSVRADFAFDPIRSCSSPANVTFSDSSVRAISWNWEFSDGASSTEKNPSHTFVLPYNSDEYAINKDENFKTTLTVESANGCSHSVDKNFVIKLPTARILADTLRGCLPLLVNFSEESFSDADITNYEWIFGDGQSSSGAGNTASHTYNTDGEFEAKLIITNQDGCTDTSYRLFVEVGKTLSPDFTLSSTNVCQNEVIQFTDNTPEASLIDYWNYKVNGEEILTNSLVASPNWEVETDTGALDVSLSVSYNGCVSSVTKTDYLYNNGPVADFNYTFDCQTPFSYNFTALPKMYDSFKWDFDDGTIETTESNPQHVFASEKNYHTKLILTNGACADTMEQVIKVRQPNATFSAVSEACSGDSIIFDPTGSYNQVDYCFEKYFWNFNDTSIRNIRTHDDTLYHYFTNNGTYKIDLITFYDNGCFDTASQDIQIFKPDLKFKIDSFVGCAPVNVAFNDSSSSYIHPMEEWNINFGDGVDSTYSGQVNRFYHIYNKVGSFEVEFSITDTFGCSAQQVETVNIGNPTARFNTLTSTEICAGNPILFAPISQSNDSAIWDFGDGIVKRDTAQIITHQYDSVGIFQAMLVVYEYGCSDTFRTAEDFIKVQKADAYFSSSDTIYNCYPKDITFKHLDQRSDIQYGRWEFGYKDNYSDYDTLRQFTFPLPGEYTVSLDIETSFGCVDKFEQKIILTGPEGSFDIAPDTACKGMEITLTVLDTSDVYSFEWDLGDGRIVEGNPVTHVYNEIGNVYPKLVLYGDSGFCIPPPFEDTLYIHELKADIGLEDSSLCAQTDITFTNATFGQSSMFWDFGDGSTSTLMEPSHSFSPGSYNISLIAHNESNCTDTMKQTVVVHALPQIITSPDTLICFGGLAIVRANGGDIVSWFPGTGLSDTSIYMPEATPDIATNYTVTVTDTTTGCPNSDEIEVSVQPVPDVSVSPLDTTIIIGESVQFVVDSVAGNTYVWSPAEYFNCINCANPIAIPYSTATLTLNVKDVNNCFTVPYTIHIEVDEQYSVDVPTAFTPNGDGINDAVYVKGWGIKKLVSFRIFNRWGNEVFFTDDINQGWDGTYQGKLQNVDTYVYVVEVETYAGVLTKKTGTLTLLQ